MSSGIDSSLYSPLSTYGSGRPDHAAVHRRPGDERFERRAQVVLPLHGAVDQHRLVGVGLAGDRVDLVAEQLLELVAARSRPSSGCRTVDSWPSPGSDHWSCPRRPPHRPAPCTGSTPGCRTPSSSNRPAAPSGLFGSTGLWAAMSCPRMSVGRVRRCLSLVSSACSAYCCTSRSMVSWMSCPATGSTCSSTQLTNDAASSIDLEDLLAPLTVQLVFHRLLDTEGADELVGVVVLGLVLSLVLLGDRAEVADDMAGQRRVRVDALPLLDDLDAREVFAALLQVRHRVFVDVFFQRQRQQRAVPLALGALRDRRFAEARVVAALEIDDRDLQRAGQPLEHRLASLRFDHAPVDGDGEDALVVGHDPTLGIEDPTALRRDQDLSDLGGGDLCSGTTPPRHPAGTTGACRRRRSTTSRPAPAHRDASCAYRSPWHHCGLRAGANERARLCAWFIRGSPSMCAAWLLRTIARAEPSAD